MGDQAIMEPPVKIALVFPWCPEVDGDQIVETSAYPEVMMRMEYVELLDGWRIEGIDVGGQSHLVTDPDLRLLKLPPVHTVWQVTIRVRNTSAEKQRFPGAKIIGTVVR